MERKLITKNDILLIGCILAFIAVIFSVRFFADRGEALTAEVYFDGKLIDSVNLTDKEEKRILTGKDSGVVIIAKNGEIFFEESSCRDKICIKSESLNSSDDFAACLPEKVIVKVIGEKSDTEPDAIVY